MGGWRGASIQQPVSVSDGSWFRRSEAYPASYVAGSRNAGSAFRSQPNVAIALSRALSLAAAAMLVAALLGADPAAGEQRVEYAPIVPERAALHVAMRSELPFLRVDADLTFTMARPLDTAVFQLRSDLQLDGIQDEAGRPLRYERREQEQQVRVFTPPIGADTVTTWRFRYRIPLQRAPHLLDQILRIAPWYPYILLPTSADEMPRRVPMRFDVSADTPPPWTLVASGAPQDRSARGRSGSPPAWSDRRPIGTLPLLIGRFAPSSTAASDGHEVEAYFATDSRAHADTYAGYMLGALDFYAGLLGPHPRRKFVLAGFDLPDRVGGLTTPGITVVPAPSTAPDTPFPYRIVAHEVAHHWWNRGAGVPLRADGWLREGLPTYSALLFLESRYGAPAFRRELDRTRRVALDVESPQPLLSSHTIASPRQRHALEYHRGAFVLHMLRTVLGRPAFERLLADLYESGDGITATAFIAAAQAQHGADLSWFFASWLTRGEVPRLSVRYRQTDAESDVSPYLLDVSIEQEEAAIRHPVLLRVVLEGAPPVQRTVWIEPGTVELSLELPSRATSVELDPEGDLLHRGVSVTRMQ